MATLSSKHPYKTLTVGPPCPADANGDDKRPDTSNYAMRSISASAPRCESAARFASYRHTSCRAGEVRAVVKRTLAYTKTTYARVRKKEHNDVCPVHPQRGCSRRWDSSGWRPMPPANVTKLNREVQLGITFVATRSYPLNPIHVQ